MYKTILALLMVISSCDLLCQTLTGIVYDENKKAIPGASVYFNGTTIGTTTDENGNYKLVMENIINANLIISFLGYQSVVIKNPFEVLNLQIYMKPKVIELQEVVVNSKKSKFNRKLYLDLFRSTFLGASRGGRSCKIKNEEDIMLKFNNRANTLYITAYKPIIIDNPYLGYIVNFYPVDCSIRFESTTIGRSPPINYSVSETKGIPGSIPTINVHRVVSTNTSSRIITQNFKFLGTISFKDLVNSKVISRRRRIAYEGSKMHFFRNFYSNIWTKDEFLLYKDAEYINPIKPKEYFKVTDSSGIKKIMFINTDPAVNTNRSGNGKGPSSKTLYVLYDGWTASKIIFRTNTFFLDKYGNYSPLDSIDFSGEMDKKRIGDWLPINFKLDK